MGLDLGDAQRIATATRRDLGGALSFFTLKSSCGVLLDCDSGNKNADPLLSQR